MESLNSMCLSVVVLELAAKLSRILGRLPCTPGGEAACVAADDVVL